MIKKRLIPITLGASALVLAACGSLSVDRNVNALESMNLSGNNFNQALAREYLDIAQFEYRKMNDYDEANLWALKGQRAANNEDVQPVSIDNWDVSTDTGRMLSEQRGRLVRALDNGGRANHPLIAADAQAHFDCWVEQLEEGHQPKHIADCRREFEDAMARLDAAMEKKPVVEPKRSMPAVTGYTLLFQFDSTDMVAASSDDFRRMVADVKRSDARVDITGHADRSGPRNYNDGLSAQRADAVRQKLIAEGVASERISILAEGETEPAVATGDGVREVQNRRVEVRLR